jgi:hypothetical protein
MKLAFLLLFALLARAEGHLPPVLAPSLRLHPQEKFRPADPAIFFRAAAPAKEAREFPLPAAAQPSSPAPWLWQKSGSRITDLLPQDARWDLIEFWYFAPFNEAGLWFGFGDHESDWEGVALLLRDGALKAAYYSQHDGGQWYCAKDLEKDPLGRIVVYAALGSHASFPRPGIYRRGLFFLGSDEVAAGETLAMALRPLSGEPYAAFSGRWGRKSFLPWNNGPISPHPERKFLPRKTDAKEADWLKENCLK